MKYLVEREKNEIALAEGITLTFIRKEDNETYIDKEPGCERILSVADGNVIVAHEGESVENAGAGDQVSVRPDGSAKIFGKFHGVCLSVPADTDHGTELIELKKEQQQLTPPEKAGKEAFMQLMTACGGYAVISLCGYSLMLEKGETLAVSVSPDEEYTAGVMGEGILLINTIGCEGTFEGAEASAEKAADGAAGDTDAEKESPEDKARQMMEEKKAAKKAAKRKISLKGATLADFINSFRISSTSNFLSRRFSRFKKEYWLDPELSWEIDKLQRRHFNAVIWVVVLALIMAFVGLQMSLKTFLLWAGAWTLIDFFIVAPFLYLLVLPKPVGSHIKKISELTEEEEKIRQKEINSDKVYHRKRVLKRY